MVRVTSMININVLDEMIGMTIVILVHHRLVNIRLPVAVSINVHVLVPGRIQQGIVIHHI